MPGDRLAGFNPFTCPNCGAFYQVVKAEAGSETSASAFELLTLFDTGQRCRKSFEAGFRYRHLPPAQPRRKLLLRQEHRHAIVDFGGEMFGSVIIIVHDFSRSPVWRSFHSSQRPAAVRSGELSRAVKYQGCFPPGVSCHS